MTFKAMNMLTTTGVRDCSGYFFLGAWSSPTPRVGFFRGRLLEIGVVYLCIDTPGTIEEFIGLASESLNG